MRRVLVAVAVVLGLARSASAQTAPDAQALFDQGKQLMTEGRDYAAACAKLAESNRLDPQLGTLLWLGGCYEKIRHDVDAWKAFDAAATLAHDKGDERESVAREHIARVEARLFKLEIDVPTPGGAGFEVRLDGALVGPASWGKPMFVEPGMHVVSAKAPTRQWAENVQAPPGASAVVTVPPLPAVLPPEPPPQHGSPSGAGWRITGWTLAALGLVGGAAVGSAFGLDAKSKNDASAGPPYNCVGALCDNVDGVNLRQHALDSALVSTVAFAVGGTLLAAGVVMVLLAPSSHRISVHAGFGPTGVTLGGTF